MAYRWEFFLQVFPRRRTTGSLGDRPGHVRVRPGRDVPNDRVTGARTTGSHTPPLGSRPGCRELAIFSLFLRGFRQVAIFM